MDEISTIDLDDVNGGINRTIRTLGTAIGLLANEPLPEIQQPGPRNPSTITRQMDPIQPPALPGGATIVRR